MQRTHIAEPNVDVEIATQLGLLPEEYERILEILGRTPTYTELGMYSVMWSEHCSYKNSILQLKKLPRSGGKLLIAAGEENAGLIDIGDGLAIAFKIESHNHPSAIEPYQGAATGVGGILRDIFTMGARPIAALNSLRFGDLHTDGVKYLLKQVVKGIGDYGNSFGVPTVGGEIYFDDCYTANPIVNAMAIGIVEHSKVVRAAAEGIGNSVFIVGSATGRDGIHGATFASSEISEDSQSRRPSVQVGDPFTEKRLLEATLEAIEAGAVAGIQDMGAAGLTCSTTEMSARAKTGMRIDLDLVPVREEKMSAYEILLSESQERMLIVANRTKEETLREIFSKWDLTISEIGQVCQGPYVEIEKDGRLCARVPAGSLVMGQGAPVYERESKKPGYLEKINRFDPHTLPIPNTSLNETLLELLGRPSIASKRIVWEQYDYMVQANTVVTSQADAAVVRIKGTRKAIAATTDCNSRYVYLNPYRGAQIAVAEAARNIVCSGAMPLAITNCLNFGNPYDPEIYWQFTESVRGIGDACRLLNTPVTGGNVSFYNESPTGPIYPTPVIGMIGLLDDVGKVLTISFKNPGDQIILLGENTGEIGGSEYLLMKAGKIAGDAPNLDLLAEIRLRDFLLLANKLELVKSAHDVSEGGIAVCLAESCLASEGLGAYVQLGGSSRRMRSDFELFGESQSMVVLSASPERAKEILRLAEENGVKASSIGIVTNNRRLIIGTEIDVPIELVRESYERPIEKMMS
jgi:phosphoribosylformylglycinamidine synthase II